MRAIVVALAMLAGMVSGVFAGPGSAAASGGWAVTYLDPPPSRFDSGTSYALGFWVLQHGTHPPKGELGPIALRFVREDGTSRRFAGTVLPEAGHYATSVVLPQGVWRVVAEQGLFEPYEVGTLTVPGSLTIDPVPPELVRDIGGSDSWGAIRPPAVPVADPAAAPSSEGAEAAGAPATPSEAGALPSARPVDAGGSAAGADGAGGVPAYTLLFAAAGGAALAVAALRLPLLSRRREPADGVAISG
ncbi:hypothetical protein E1286_35330 [Nonomuraea terrae]|uniref:Uncharacterized protein n=1 Tax=Nonomuraea terrae TaxID=2530383 RepID=A0A4V2YJN3_9ACTN|nr:hypothetical protein [Nonomuraea terrae]TDD39377.1 hypothetical protein E1286_35330 [Nonomuraea terrae]